MAGSKGLMGLGGLLHVQVLCAVLIALAPLTALAEEKRALDDGPSGVTCTNYSHAGRLAWQRKQGDWVDSVGTMHGDAAYGQAAIGRGALADGIRIDVTALARAWLQGVRPNTGVFLRAAAGNGTIAFDSRENTEGQPPLLELEWRNDTVSRHPASADTTIDCSTYRSVGRSKTIRVARDKNALLVFDLPAARADDLVRATVVLTPSRLYGRSVTIAAFSPQPPWAEPSVPRTDGIAARHPGDQGIGAHPEVLFFADFEAEDWQSDWNRHSKSEMQVVAEDGANRFAPLRGRALRTTLKEGLNTALNLRYLFGRKLGHEPEEVYFRYYLRLGNDWNPDLEGGKFPGLAGTYGKGGWGMRKSDGTNGWSVRGLFAQRAPARGDAPALTPIGSYVYHADMRGNSGNHWGWNLGPGGLLANNRWYSVEQHLKLNTPGKKDGVFRAWIDGHLVFERTGLNFRSVPELRIESLWLNVYHGGTRPSPRDMSVYIDNIVVAHRYIGPIVP